MFLSDTSSASEQVPAAIAEHHDLSSSEDPSDISTELSDLEAVFQTEEHESAVQLRQEMDQEDEEEDDAPPIKQTKSARKKQKMLRDEFSEASSIMAALSIDADNTRFRVLKDLAQAKMIFTYNRSKSVPVVVGLRHKIMLRNHGLWPSPFLSAKRMHDVFVSDEFEQLMDEVDDEDRSKRHKPSIPSDSSDFDWPSDLETSSEPTDVATSAHLSSGDLDHAEDLKRTPLYFQVKHRVAALAPHIPMAQCNKLAEEICSKFFAILSKAEQRHDHRQKLTPNSTHLIHFPEIMKCSQLSEVHSTVLDNTVARMDRLIKPPIDHRPRAHRGYAGKRYREKLTSLPTVEKGLWDSDSS